MLSLFSSIEFFLFLLIKPDDEAKSSNTDHQQKVFTARAPVEFTDIQAVFCLGFSFNVCPQPAFVHTQKYKREEMDFCCLYI